MLKNTEWNTINNILLELYTMKDIKTLTSKVMKVLRMLIPYTKGYFVMLDEEQQIRNDCFYFIGMDSNTIEKYIHHYYNEDYLTNLYEIANETMVFQDTKILDDDIRKNTEFYQKFLLPLDIPYGCGILIIRNNRIVCMFNLFRSESLGDFSEKEIYILNLNYSRNSI